MTLASFLLHLLATLIIGLLYLVEMAAFLTLNVLTTRTTLSEEGIGGFGSWGQPRTFAWRDIISVKEARFLGERVLHLSSVDSKRITLPLDLADPRGFWAAVDRYAPLGNPVRQYMNLHSLNSADR